MAGIPKLTDEQWAELLERLTYYAVRKYRKSGWRRGDRRKFEWAGPDGASPQDVALEAITSVIERTRKYDPEVCPEFIDFLRSVVDSKISHMLEKAVRRRTGRMPVVHDPEAAEHVEADLPGKAPDPAGVCMNREVIERARAVLEMDAEKDSLVLQVFECLEADITKPAEMAEMLDVKVSKIYDAQKRLRRKINRALKGEEERER